MDGMNQMPETPARKKKTGGGAKFAFFFAGAVVGIVGGAIGAYFGLQSAIKPTIELYENQIQVYEDRLAKQSELGEGAVNPIVTQEFADKVGELTNIIDEIYYFQDLLDYDDIREKIYATIMSSIGDKYSQYYTYDEWHAEQDDMAGTYYGIGSYVAMDTELGYPKLSGVFEGSPAQASGLRDGDVIIAVDGESISGWTLDEAVSHIRGPENTEVKLTIVRGAEQLDITVVRGKVHTIEVKSEMKRDDIGYIQITGFSEVAVDQFAKALKDLKSQNAKGIVLDLRGNPGGNLSAVLAIGQQLLPEGRITYIEDRNGSKKEYYCNGKNEIKIPMVVLVNGYSASASELLTGALRDYKKATVIGTTTYGKGIVQNLYELSDGSGMKLTSSAYFTPNGECIHGTGITPDIELEFDSEAYYNAENPVDNQLEYAIDYLAK